MTTYMLEGTVTRHRWSYRDRESNSPVSTATIRTPSDINWGNGFYSASSANESEIEFPGHIPLDTKVRVSITIG